MTPDETRLLRHFLAALAYRTQKAVRDAPPGFGEHEAGEGVRTPAALVQHMTSVLGYARTYFVGGVYRPEPLDRLEVELHRFHAVLTDLSRLLEDGVPLHDLTPEQLLQGPFADAMTHAGQLAMLRRLAGAPVSAENFLFAEIDTDHVGADQPLPAAPNSPWLGRLIHLAWRFTAWRNRRRRR